MDHQGVAFEQVLDARLAASWATAPPVAPAVDSRPDPGLRAALAGAFDWLGRAAAGFERGYGTAAASTAARRPAAGRPAAGRPAAVPPPAPSRPARTLPASQREALGRLRQWGADLSDDFTADELKRAYRRLARQFHPDAHASAPAAVRAALGGAFHQIHLAYRLLSPS